MTPLEALHEAGGIADAALLRARCGRSALRRAVVNGDIVLIRRGVYGVPGIPAAEQRAAELSGVIVGPSAALLWGWPLKHPPQRPHIALAKGRRLTPRQRSQITPHWSPHLGDLTTGDNGIRIQTPLATAVHCLRTLPFDEALCVADGALRSGRLIRDDLLAEIAGSPRTGRSRAEAVARAADRRAANPFETCLRAICRTIPGLDVEPQVQIGPYQVDLADRRRKIVIEADSREWHAGPVQHDNDIRRYTTLVREGWIVLRFSYHDVIHDPAYVAAALRDALRLTVRVA